MFTGIVQAQGIISALNIEGTLLHLGIEFPDSQLEALQIGASVSVDGACLTVTGIQKNTVFFDAIEETLHKTTLKYASIGQKVNLERAAKLGDEIGGHFLSGHISDTATLLKIEDNIYTFQIDPKWTKYFFPKGFIALNGVSLTIVEVDKKNASFTVHLIPETLKRTTFCIKKFHEKVNFEIDALTQATVDTVESLLSAAKNDFSAK